MTRYQVLTNVDFESATAASIANDVVASQITLSRIDSKSAMSSHSRRAANRPPEGPGSAL